MRRELVLKVRLSAAELTRVERLAEARGIRTRAGLIRALVREAGTPDDPLGLNLLLAQIAESDAGDLER
jgi:hypothetical protein